MVCHLLIWSDEALAGREGKRRKEEEETNGEQSRGIKVLRI